MNIFNSIAHWWNELIDWLERQDAKWEQRGYDWGKSLVAKGHPPDDIFSEISSSVMVKGYTGAFELGAIRFIAEHRESKQ